MRLLNPWALTGLVAVAAPIVAHLLARRPARRQPFPTLRFLPASTPRPVSRERLTDLGLLALRCLILAAAAFALAQPLWVSADRARDLGRQIARAIVVDTSASMRRVAARTSPTQGQAQRPSEPLAPQAAGASGSQGAGPGGSLPLAIDRAREIGRALASDATTARIVETDAPATLVAGAQAWLAAQPMRRELVVVSDFQAGTIASSDLIGLPADTGIRLEAVTAAGPVTTDAVLVEAMRPVTLLAGDTERDLALAARTAATATGAPERTGNVAVLFPGYSGRADLLRSARPLRSAAAFAVFDRITRDPLVVEAIARAGNRAAEFLSASEADVDGQASIVVALASSPSPATAAAVVRAAAIAASPLWIPDSERLSDVMPEAERAILTRPTPESAIGRTPDESHARWVWVGVLGLLIAEMLVRRQRRPADIQEASRARVA